MSKPNVVVVIGTRPEAIKMMPLVNALRASRKLDVSFVTTGQHRGMLDQVLEVFDEKPDIDLNLMRTNQTLADITANVITSMSELFAKQRPELVLVHGDTTTAMATALAAFYAKIPIGHVEAGLRTFDLSKPWPEEWNRVAIDSMADFMFAPTQGSASNLRAEYNRRGKIYVTGNTGIDALFTVAAKIESSKNISAALEARYHYLRQDYPLLLVTGHRRESFGKGFEQICDALKRIASTGRCDILYPVHLNPNIRSVVNQRLEGVENIRLIDPVSYVDMVYLMGRSRILLTDSGGIQEEGPALGCPVLVMRDVTERPEAVATGVVQMVGTDPDTIAGAVEAMLDCPAEYARRARAVFPYGDGTASTQIVKAIEENFTS